MIGVEEQTNVHFAMPVKNMVYDALNYAAQVADIAKEHKTQKDKLTSEEFLSGLKKSDRLKPVITIVVYLGSSQWDGPRRLHDMLNVTDANILNYVNDYKINLIAPYEITDFDKFHTELRYVLEFIQKSVNESAIGELMENNKNIFSNMDSETAFMLNKCTHIELKFEKKERKVDMCKAWDDHFKSGEKNGEKKGESRFADLTQKLILANRTDDLLKATSDEIYRRRLYEEFNIGTMQQEELQCV